jgi:hypothetical protein
MSGTTSIQHFLVNNRSALEKRGIYVPSAMRRGAQHIDLPLLFGPRRQGLEQLAGPRIGTIDEQRELAAKAFAAEMAKAAGGGTLLLSSEHLFFAGVASIDGFRRLFAPYAERFESLMYLRRQDRWIASVVLQRRKSGARPDTDMAIGPDTGFGSSQAFERAVRSWDGGSDRCHIRRFDTEFPFGGSLLEDFRDLIGCNDAELTSVDVQNHTPLQEQLELADALNRVIEPRPVDQKSACRSRFFPLCTEILGGRPFEFPRAAAKAAFDAYASVNTWLREAHDPDGPPFFFDDDFSDYPVEAHNESIYTMEQLLELSASIEQQLRELGLGVPTGRRAATRADVVAHLMASFIALHDGEVERARATRRAAAMVEHRRRAFDTGSFVSSDSKRALVGQIGNEVGALLAAKDRRAALRHAMTAVEPLLRDPTDSLRTQISREVFNQLAKSGVCYQGKDFESVDYDQYELAPNLPMFRGPAVSQATLDQGRYFCVIGAAQTFGRLVRRPWPLLLSEALDLPVLNLGRGGVGPEFYLRPKLIDYARRARFVVLQIMSGRSGGPVIADGEEESDENRRLDILRDVWERKPKIALDYVRKWNEAYLDLYKRLSILIERPVLLAWISDRRPEDWDPEMFLTNRDWGRFPQLVGRELYEDVAEIFNDRLISVTGRSVEQPISRVTGEPCPYFTKKRYLKTVFVYYPSTKAHALIAQEMLPWAKKHATSA